MFAINHVQQVKNMVSELKTTQNFQLEALNSRENMATIDADIIRLRAESQALQERAAKGLTQIQWSLLLLALAVVLIPIAGIIFF